jgi:hypothetical protein
MSALSVRPPIPIADSRIRLPIATDSRDTVATTPDMVESIDILVENARSPTERARFYFFGGHIISFLYWRNFAQLPARRNALHIFPICNLDFFRLKMNI